MRTIGILGNGPLEFIPNLDQYKPQIDIWIGADRGALTLLEHDIPVDYAVGDFDSMEAAQLKVIKQSANQMETYAAEKDETDLELAIDRALALEPDTIYLFGVTGGRLDHALVNIQLLSSIVSKDITGIIIDQQNWLEMKLPGTYTVKKNDDYTYISFLSYSKSVNSITLSGFRYPLENANITWGSTLSVSNEFASDIGTYTFEDGILLMVKSRDAI